VGNLDEILALFEPISLKEMDGVKLMNRSDTKFMFSLDTLESVLREIAPQYRVLEIAGVRQGRYETLYYDTPDFYFYRRHHSGKKNRYKVRKRSYVDSHLAFLEVKFKSNKDRTIKDRTKLADEHIHESLEAESLDFIRNNAELELSLEPKMWNSFKRITLVNRFAPERLTIDCGLSFRHGEETVSLPNLVIAEVKQERRNRNSPVMAALKKRLIRPESISKYCLGVAMLVKSQKNNGFKEKLMNIRKIEHGMVA
jgi:hypothetical protein